MTNGEMNKRSGGNDPKSAPATQPKGEKPQSDFDDLTEKEILMGIWMELQRMNGAQSTEDASEPVYLCRKCEWEGTKEERERHARDTHKAPPDMLDSLFTKVDPTKHT